MKIVRALALCALFVTAPAVAQTYYEAPLTGDGAGWVVRTDLGKLPANNDDASLVPYKELINEGRPDNDQAYLGLAMAQNYICLTDHAYGTRCGSTQASLILPFSRKATANVKLIFETPAPLLHVLINGAPLWVGTPPGGPEYMPYPDYPTFARVWNTNHLTRHNLSMVLMLPWPNSVVSGQVLPTLIDNVVGSRNRMWVITERPAPRPRR
jgi:hypothetical protein